MDLICKTLGLNPPTPLTKQQCQLFIALNLRKAAAVWKRNKARGHFPYKNRGPSRRSLQRDADFTGTHCSPQAILDYLSSGGLAPRNMNGTREEIIARLRGLGYTTTTEQQEREFRERLEYERMYPDGWF